MIRFSQPSLLKEDILAATEVLESGWLKQGKIVRAVEERISELTGRSGTLLLSNCTAAIFMALSHLRVSGKEVILPSLSFGAIVSAILAAGGIPVLADCMDEAPLLSIESVKKLITPNTKAIIPVHLYGLPCNVKELIHLASKNNIEVIEDVAYGLGTFVNDIHAGNFGRFGCLSFGSLKAITCGEGGALLCDSTDIKELEPCREYGMSRIHNTKIFTHIGLNYKTTEFQAALILNQLKRYKKIQRVRNSIREEYEKNFLKHGLNLTVEIHWGKRNDCFVPIKLPNNSPFANIISQRLANLGIETDLPFLMHKMSAYKNHIKYSQSLENSEKWANKIICLPCHSQLTQNDIKKVVQSVVEVINE